MANADEIAEEFLMEIAMLRPARRTMPLLVDFVYHQISSLNNEALANDVLEILTRRIDQEYLQPRQQQPAPLVSPLMEPEVPQLPPSPAASTISIISSQTIESTTEEEAPPPLNLEPPAIQFIPVIPVIPCILDPHRAYSVTLPVPPPPPGYVNPSRAILRTQLASFYPSTPVMIKSTTFDIHVEYQVMSSVPQTPQTQTCPTNGEVQ